MKTTPNETVFLLVEDDRNDVFFVEREFKQAPGHLRLKVVCDGAEAIEYLCGHGKFSNRAEFPIPNIILLDLKMPRISGFQFLEWLRTSSPGNLRIIPVLVMSSSRLTEDVRRAYELGANSYLVKPVSWSEFRKMVNDLGLYWTELALIPHLIEAQGI